MKAIAYPIEHQLQTQNLNCGQTALSMLLTSMSNTKSIEECEKLVSNYTGNTGSEWGSLAIDCATACIKLDYDVTFYSFDCRITDFSWTSMSATQVLERLSELEKNLVIPSLGAELTKIYIQGYQKFLKAGGNLKILPYPTSMLLHDLIEKAPFTATVCFNTLHGSAKTRTIGLRQTVPDDVEGITATHAIVVYGRDAQGSFLFADPWETNGLFKASAEQLIAAIMAAGRDCESVLFQAERK
jgi:hypothetical protein